MRWCTSALKPFQPMLGRTVSLDETDGVAHDAETVVGLERKRSFAHPPAAFVFLPDLDGCAVGLEKWNSCLKIDAQGTVEEVLLAILIKRVVENPNAPQRLLTDGLEVGANSVAHFLELIGDFRDFVARECEAHHVVRPVPARVFLVDALLVESIHHFVPRRLELTKTLHEGALLGWRDDHNATGATLALDILLLGLPVETFHRWRDNIGVGEVELEHNEADTVVENHDWSPEKSGKANILHDFTNKVVLRAKSCKMLYVKELFLL